MPRYLPEVEIGDYVLVHVGFAISKVDAEEAARTYDTWRRWINSARSPPAMKYLDEYRDDRVAKKILDEIRRTVTRRG